MAHGDFTTSRQIITLYWFHHILRKISFDNDIVIWFPRKQDADKQAANKPLSGTDLFQGGNR
jgi:hypothetical protein